MYKIVNIRGTHGSGKSHIIRRLLDLYDWEPVGLNNRGHPLNHLITNSSTGPIYVVGGYTNVCGGCDGTQPYSLIWPRVQEFADRGHVLFEGALISCSYGSIGRSSEAYGDRFIFAFINTPFDLCVARVKERRAKVRNPKPFDPPPETVRSQKYTG